MSECVALNNNVYPAFMTVEIQYRNASGVWETARDINGFACKRTQGFPAVGGVAVAGPGTVTCVFDHNAIYLGTFHRVVLTVGTGLSTQTWTTLGNWWWVPPGSGIEFPTNPPTYPVGPQL